MKRTGAGALTLAALIGAGVGFLIDNVLSATGRPTFTPAVSLPILLLMLGAIVVVLAVPVYRGTRGHTSRPVNPFRALRIAMLAKASSIVGAAIGGGAAGMLIFLVTRPVVPSLGSMATIIATVASGAVLVAAALVAEQLCTIRKDDDDEQPGGALPGPGGADEHH